MFNERLYLQQRDIYFCKNELPKQSNKIKILLAAPKFNFFRYGRLSYFFLDALVTLLENLKQTQHLKINSIGDSNIIQIHSHLAIQQMHDASYERVIDDKDISAPVLDSPTDLSCFQQFLR